MLSASCIINIEIIIMGKNLSQASHVISKKEKQQFNSLIKVLQPKVYITDCSTFNKLVQELTGNGSSTNPKMAKDCPLVGADVPMNHPETRIEVLDSTKATTSSSESCYAAMMNDEFNQVCSQICLEDIVLEDSMASQPIDHLWAYENLESLLFDVEPNPFMAYYCMLLS